MGLKRRVCSYLKKGRGKRGLRVSGTPAPLCWYSLLGPVKPIYCREVEEQLWLCTQSSLFTDLSWGCSSGQQEIPAAVSLSWAVAKPILTLRAAKVLLHSQLQPQLVGLS